MLKPLHKWLVGTLLSVPTNYNHYITAGRKSKGNGMDNGAMENFFGRLKVEMFCGEKFESVTPSLMN